MVSPISSNAASAGLSGIHAALSRLGNSAHNTANLLTEDFHPLSTGMRPLASVGVEAVTTRARDPLPVDWLHEFVQQRLSVHHFRASARVAGAALEMRGFLIDLRA